MIIIKSDSEIRLMRKAGALAAAALAAAGDMIEQGVSTKAIDKIVSEVIRAAGAKASFLGYGGFPASCCVSCNNVVIHGIPKKSVTLKNGDIVSVDVGVFLNGFHGDTAATFIVGQASQTARQLVQVTKESLERAQAVIKAGVRLGDIGHTVEEYVTQFGFTPVTDFVGHGIGRNLHEDPAIPNTGIKGHGLRLPKGATIAVEPMINEGVAGVTIDANDGWTVTTNDGKLSAHFEHTFYVDNDCAHILTVV